MPQTRSLPNGAHVPSNEVRPISFGLRCAEVAMFARNDRRIFSIFYILPPPPADAAAATRRKLNFFCCLSVASTKTARHAGMGRRPQADTRKTAQRSFDLYSYGPYSYGPYSSGAKRFCPGWSDEEVVFIMRRHLDQCGHIAKHSHGLYSYGLYIYGLYSCGLCSCGLCTTSVPKLMSLGLHRSQFFRKIDKAMWNRFL